MRAGVSVAIGFAALLSLSASAAGAATYVIDNFPQASDSRTPNGSMGSVGEDASFEAGLAGFFGQSFAAPSTGAILAQDLLFSAYSWSGTLKYRILIIDAGPTSPSGLNIPTPLFESPELFLAPGGWTNIDIDLNNTPLVGGEFYLWVIDAYSDRNGVTGVANVGARNDFAGGDFFYGGYLGAPGTPRSSIGLSPFGESIDLAFRMTFAAVPEPSSWILMLLGFVGLGASLRRRSVEALSTLR